MICLRISSAWPVWYDTARARHFFDDFIRTTDRVTWRRRTFLECGKKSGVSTKGHTRVIVGYEAFLKPKRNW